MSLHLDVSCIESTTKIENVHLTPCSIEYDGDAHIRDYFSSNIRSHDDNGLTASLRGRPLNGKVLDIPQGFTGLVLKEINRPLVDDEDRQLTVIRTFDKFTYWNLDRVTSADDKIVQAVEWLDIAKTLHSPVTDEDSQKSCTDK